MTQSDGQKYGHNIWWQIYYAAFSLKIANKNNVQIIDNKYFLIQS